MSHKEKPILFHYPASVFSYRVLWYLWLRGIPYDECIQPHVMPRPDLASIGVHYRRIPLMAIGKDVYCDSRLIISTLESLYPDSDLAMTTPNEAGIRKLLENWTIDGGIFWNAVKMMPYWTSEGLLQDDVFLDDREKLTGRRMTAKGMESNRPDGLQHLRQALDMLENTFLRDGRRWILGTEKPTLADVDGVWPFVWMMADPWMKGSLPQEYVNEQIYPNTCAWVRRFVDEIAIKKASAPRPTSLDRTAMQKRVLNASSEPQPTDFNIDDPLKLQSGDQIEVFASDYGSLHKDSGAIIGFTLSEVVIRNAKNVHVHFPRWNFRINKLEPQTAPSNHTSLVSQPKITKEMRLIYHHASAYTRKVYILALELGLASHISLQKVVVCPIPFHGWSDNNEEVAVYNPMGKIPCLVSEDVPDGIFDSRTICEYLSSLVGVKPKNNTRHWAMKTLHACADGMMDAAVLITYELRIREQRGLKFDEWIEGQRTKILRGLNRFEAAAKGGTLVQMKEGTPASADEIAVAVATAMTESKTYLDIKWREGRPHLEEWMKGWEGRKSFLESPPTKEWGVDRVKSASKI